MRATSPTRQPRLLVSVRDADEAALALAAGADLVDAKDPGNGALGALPVETVRAIVAQLEGRVATSAVAGEPETQEALPACVGAMAATGVDFVKVALRRGWAEAALARAAREAPDRLIGVLFAEDLSAEDFYAEAASASAVAGKLSAAGWRGLMIDTRGKRAHRLTDLLRMEDLSRFVESCRAHGLLSGLAGSLELADIPALAPLAPGYLGFRGGLCAGSDRRAALDPSRIAEAARRLRANAQRDAA